MTLLLLFWLGVGSVVCAERDALCEGIPLTPRHSAHGLVVYNRIPKAGSATLRAAVEGLAQQRNITVANSEGFFLELRPSELPGNAYRVHQVRRVVHFPFYSAVLWANRFGKTLVGTPYRHGTLVSSTTTTCSTLT
jgi:hypothetical protein